MVLPGLTVPIGRLRVGAVPATAAPFPVQAVEARMAGVGGVAGALSTLPGVTLGNQTGSPHQSDIRIRGFAVSPIVGLPQSVGVFLDGVRINEADASQVHLSLVPTHAVERVELIRGPVGSFGKNALAGALNLVTARASGPDFLELEGQAGTFETGSGTVRAGGERGPYHGLVSGTHRRSEGWRDLERSRETSIFTKVGRTGPRSDAWLSYTLEVDSLQGPGPLPASWIDGAPLPADIGEPPDDRRRLQYTGGVGDAFRATLHFLNGSVTRALSDETRLQATAFGRAVDFRQGNDNVTEPDALGLTDITSFGTTVQLSHRPSGRLLILGGAEAVRNNVDIDIRERPNAAFPDVVTATTERIRTRENNVAAFAETWWALNPRMALHSSLRFDYTSLPVTDLLNPEDSGENSFAELSGGLGITVDLGRGSSGFAGYGRGFRAPVILEVSCADPEDPCQLPFELGPDPPLKPVRSDNLQVGLRAVRSRVQAEAIGYWTEVSDDLFNVVALDQPTRGYFTNLDRTRRIGAEARLELSPIPSQPALRVDGTLAWTRATFETNATLTAPFLDDDDPADPGDPGAEPGLEPPEVEPGDRFPMVPAFSFSVGARYALGPTSLSVQAQRVGEQIYIGDEGNVGAFGRLSGYTLVRLRAERSMDDLVVFLDVDNLLDTEYAPFGIISPNVRGEEEVVERFLTPGRPRTISIGARLRLERGRSR